MSVLLLELIEDGWWIMRDNTPLHGPYPSWYAANQAMLEYPSVYCE